MLNFNNNKKLLLFSDDLHSNNADSKDSRHQSIVAIEQNSHKPISSVIVL